MKQRHQNRIIKNEDILVYSQRIHSSAIFKKEVSNSNLFICLCLLVFLCIRECVSCDLVIMEDVRENLLPGTITQVVVNHHTGAGNKSFVLFNSDKCSYLLSYSYSTLEESLNRDCLERNNIRCACLYGILFFVD